MITGRINAIGGDGRESQRCRIAVLDRPATLGVLCDIGLQAGYDRVVEATEGDCSVSDATVQAIVTTVAVDVDHGDDAVRVRAACTCAECDEVDDAALLNGVANAVAIEVDDRATNLGGGSCECLGRG